MIHLANLLTLLLDIYMYVIIASVAVSWLVAFDVINRNHPQAANLVNALNRVTEPVYKPIRKFIKPIGGFDLSPIVVLIAIAIVKDIVLRILL